MQAPRPAVPAARLPPLLALGLALAAPWLTLLVLLPVLGIAHTVPFIFFVPGVIAAGWAGGPLAGLIGALASGLVVNRFVLSEAPQLDTSVAGLVSTGFFVALGAVLAAGAWRFRAREAHARALAREVERSLELERAARAVERAEAQERARIAELLREGEERFRTLVETLPQLVFTLSPDGAVEFSNRRALEYGGFTEEEVQGGILSRLVHPDDVAPAKELRRRALENGEAASCELRLRRADGVHRWFLVGLVPLRAADGRVLRWFGTCTEIQAQKEALEAQAEAVHARDVFLSIASHELKTPLAAAQLQIQSAQRQLRKEPAENVAALAARLDATAASVERLGTLVNSLLDVSHVASRRLVTRSDPLDLSSLVRQSAGRLAEAARRRGSELIVEVEPGVEMLGDPMRLEQLVSNLLGNAIKYGEGRPIEVRLRRLAEERAELSVRDQGIGIAHADQARIFLQFERAASARHYGGLGLGLWIAHQIVEASGGSIRVESGPGEGATFTVELPLPRQELPASADAGRRAS